MGSLEFSDVDAFAAKVDDIGAALGDLTEPSRSAAALALGEVRAPVRTGALAKTDTAEATALGFTLSAGGPTAPYAGPVHARDPFLTDALTARETDIVDEYGDYVERTIDTI